MRRGEGQMENQTKSRSHDVSMETHKAINKGEEREAEKEEGAD